VLKDYCLLDIFVKPDIARTDDFIFPVPNVDFYFIEESSETDELSKESYASEKSLRSKLLSLVAPPNLGEVLF
jgi:hypothetical protein